MRKIISITFAMLLVMGSAFGAWDASKPSDSEKLKDTPALIRANWNAIATGTDAALQITNAKVAAAAAIADTKLATISTAGKVSGTAITGLASLPSGAGAVPIANGGTGQTTRQAALDALVASAGGSSGQALITNATNASWGYPGGLTISSQAAGDLLYFNGSAWTRLGAGTAGKALISVGTSAPAWGSVGIGTTANINGTLGVANGGTGGTTAQGAMDMLTIPTTGTSGQAWVTDGTHGGWAASGGWKLITSTQSWTAPTGITDVFITAVGAGGGGGSGDTNNGGGGGGGGAYIIRAGVKVTAGNSYTVTIGAHGVGQAGGSYDGTAGTSTSFPADNATITCAGGSGGGRYTTGGNGGTGGAGAGSYSASGTTAGGPAVTTTGGTGGTRTGEPAGAGAGSPFGVGGSPVVDSVGGVGAGYGTGGAGGSEGAGYQAGGSGTDGMVLIEW